MKLAEIESQLEALTPDELRRLALKSWRVFVEKEGGRHIPPACDEDDPLLLAALDEAVAKAEVAPGQGSSGEEVRARLEQWSSR